MSEPLPCPKCGKMKWIECECGWVGTWDELDSYVRMPPKSSMKITIVDSAAYERQAEEIARLKLEIHQLKVARIEEINEELL